MSQKMLDNGNLSLRNLAVGDAHNRAQIVPHFIRKDPYNFSIRVFRARREDQINQYLPKKYLIFIFKKLSNIYV